MPIMACSVPSCPKCRGTVQANYPIDKGIVIMDGGSMDCPHRKRYDARKYVRLEDVRQNDKGSTPRPSRRARD